MAAFTNLNKETIGKACREFKSCVETNGDLFEYVILVKKFLIKWDVSVVFIFALFK